MRRKTERQGTEAERQLAWSREYLRREKRRRVLRRTLLMLVLALACAVTVFALNGGIPALRVGGAPASGSSAAQSSSAPAVQAQPPSSQAQPEPARLQNQESEEPDMNHWMMKISGMMCQHCVAHVTKAIEALGAQAQIDLEAGTASVKAPSAVTAEQLRSAVADAGYEVISVQKA